MLLTANRCVDALTSETWRIAAAKRGSATAGILPRAVLLNYSSLHAELVVAMAIIALLVSIAYPSYRVFVLRSHRAEATMALVDVAKRMERYFATNLVYTNDFVALGLGGEPYITDNGHYSIRVRDNGGGGGACPIAICFELEAAPIGPQADDTECALFQLNSSRERGALDDDDNQNDSCW